MQREGGGQRLIPTTLIFHHHNIIFLFLLLVIIVVVVLLLHTYDATHLNFLVSEGEEESFAMLRSQPVDAASVDCSR